MQSETSVNGQHAWLKLGAGEKALSVTRLTQGLGVATVLEVGAGSGAVLEELDRLAYGREYYAVEPSPSLYQHLTEAASIGRLKSAEQETLSSSSLAARHYDLVIVSHVLEHVEDPARLLSDCLDVGDHVLAEVPLEGTWLGDLRFRARSVVSDTPRNVNPAGHIQFFSQASFNQLVHWAGGEVVSSRLYVPADSTEHLVRAAHGPRKAYGMAMAGLRHITGDGLWARHYYGHYATLIRKRAAIPESERSNAGGNYYYEERSVA